LVTREHRDGLLEFRRPRELAFEREQNRAGHVTARKLVRVPRVDDDDVFRAEELLEVLLRDARRVYRVGALRTACPRRRSGQGRREQRGA
jgi:hypothetical protein